MLAELTQYENLGTPGFFLELLEKLRDSKVTWTESDVQEYFSNRIIDGRMIFDGCLPLAEALGLIAIKDDGSLVPDASFIARPFDEGMIRAWLLDRLLKSCKDDEMFLDIMRAENVTYDVVYRLIQVDKAAFAFEHSAIRQLFVTLEFLSSHPDEHIRKYIVHSRYRRLFDQQVLPEIRRRKIGLEKLEEMLERNQIHGLEAEEYVLEYEKRRLDGHQMLSRVERISDYDVGAGYDIVSYESGASTTLDRFIEVKSYEDILSFFWSRNEVEVSRVKRGSYYLYLVDRKKYRDSSYVPFIIQNPYDEVFQKEREWPREAPKWFFKK